MNTEIADIDLLTITKIYSALGAKRSRCKADARDIVAKGYLAYFQSEADKVSLVKKINDIFIMNGLNGCDVSVLCFLGKWLSDRPLKIETAFWRHPCALKILDSIFFKDMDLASVPRPNHRGLILDYIAYFLTLVT